MSRKIIAYSFVVFAFFISIYSSIKIQNICRTTVTQIDSVIELCNENSRTTKDEANKVLEYWKKNYNTISIFVGSDNALNIKLMIDEIVYYSDTKENQILKETARSCKKALYEIFDSNTFSFSKLL